MDCRRKSAREFHFQSKYRLRSDARHKTQSSKIQAKTPVAHQGDYTHARANSEAMHVFLSMADTDVHKTLSSKIQAKRQ